MRSIPDDPIIACIERTGFPPWMAADAEEASDAEEDPGEKEDE